MNEVRLDSLRGPLFLGLYEIPNGKPHKTQGICFIPSSFRNSFFLQFIFINSAVRSKLVTDSAL